MIGDKQHSFQAQPEEKDKEAGVTQPGISGIPHRELRSARWSARRQRDAGLLLMVLMLGMVTIWEPPDGKYGIMTTAVDTRGKVWFVEQGANYIGRFDPATQTFRPFPLGIVNGHPLGPQDLQFDARGQLWFTALLGGRIGRLDPTTGAVQTWPVPSPNPTTPATPFSLTVTPDEQVWFGDITGGIVGHLNPATGRITLYHLADSQVEVFAMAHDSR